MFQIKHTNIFDKKVASRIKSNQNKFEFEISGCLPSLLEINIIDDLNESRKPLHCYTKMNQTNIQTSFNRKLESRIRLSRSKQLAKNRHLVLTNINDSKKADVQSNVKSSMKSIATMQTMQKIIVIIAELPPQDQEILITSVMAHLTNTAVSLRQTNNDRKIITSESIKY